jgi:hypothetical protein
MPIRDNEAFWFGRRFYLPKRFTNAHMTTSGARARRLSETLCSTLLIRDTVLLPAQLPHHLALAMLEH